MHVLEACANSYESAISAQQGGAHRIELCQNLEAGGITPSIGLITRVKQASPIPVHVLIRPRSGDFVYTDEELEIMLEDVQACRALNCDAVVVGVLTDDNRVDVPSLIKLVRAAKPMPVTFHRAFDDCTDLPRALEDVIRSGCVRILTSGGADTAIEGMSTIKQLVDAARGRVFVMPGAGVTLDNLELLVKTTGATEVHASAKVEKTSSYSSRFSVKQWQTDTSLVKSLVEILARIDTKT